MRNIEGGIRMHSFQLMGCGIVLKLMAGCGIQTASDLLKNLTRRDREKDSESGGMAG